jgi:hypothetical protein
MASLWVTLSTCLRRWHGVRRSSCLVSALHAARVGTGQRPRRVIFFGQKCPLNSHSPLSTGAQTVASHCCFVLRVTTSLLMLALFPARRVQDLRQMAMVHLTQRGNLERVRCPGGACLVRRGPSRQPFATGKCLPTSPGFYQPQAGQTKQLPCPAATANPTSQGAVRRQICMAGRLGEQYRDLKLHAQLYGR